eukprot:CAMPEP_0117884024 /NCGR_PEP_ID=MMETSP0950-20121206/18580_1 /TAXON_ID=44440 /ORGANISM="Chattonella subsalsa, Strain CCMP2191" /LENGTH=163 /DNA_ID=CAMNT_0005740205 /DNA_START=209 /DNA_END=700 /DNA_ORIENTATION=-
MTTSTNSSLPGNSLYEDSPMPSAKTTLARNVSVTAASLIPKVPTEICAEEQKVEMIVSEEIPQFGAPAFDSAMNLVGFYETEYREQSGTTVIFKKMRYEKCSPVVKNTISKMKSKISQLDINIKKKLYRLHDYSDIHAMKESCFEQTPLISPADVFGAGDTEI